MLFKRKETVTLSARKVKIVAMCALAGSFALASVPAYAASKVEAHVKVDATDLQSEDGLARIYRQLTEKAVTACANRSRDGSPKPETEAVCQTHLMDDFIKSVNDNGLTEYHQNMQR